MPELNSSAEPPDHALAASVAWEAGELLVRLRARLVAEGVDTARLKDEGDRQAHELIVSLLAPQVERGDAVLSEEGRDDPARLAAHRVWIVDPLDGTREFGEPPRTDWAVHVALAIDGCPAAGAVALPALELVLGNRTGARAAPGPRRAGPGDRQSIAAAGRRDLVGRAPGR